MISRQSVRAVARSSFLCAAINATKCVTAASIHSASRCSNTSSLFPAVCQSLAQRRTYASSNYPTHAILSMPALSPTMTQGNLGKWHKKIGDQISPGDVLVEIETDKAQMDFECQEEGFLAKILIPAGEKDVAVNTPIAVIADNAQDVDKFSDFVSSGPAPTATTKATPTPAPTTALPPPVAAAPAPTPTSSSSDRTFISPIAKALAAERGISLASIKGSGPGGRIVKADIESYSAPVVTGATHAQTTVTPVTPVASSAGSAFTDIPLSNVRKVIASRLTQSKSTIPHFYLTVQINVDKILKLREALNKEGNGKYKLSVNDFTIKASALALKDVPEVNSAWHDTFIRQSHSADIAVAVATETGLITPIIHSAEGKGLAAISNQTKELAEKARAGKLVPHEYQGGTFTISNLGMFGVQHFTAIINPPHAAILAVGGIEDKLVLDDLAPKGFRVQKTMNVTLSNDHRVVDGAVGAKWLQRFKQYLENPLTMLL
ncbi:pyruvate dehydrogenase complex dihydrolipoamide acetyltransferase component (E2) [Batrachochytrium dendrobatidis]|nr:pyruvate dehydrogenase complex dihydrolipoamide acetyltransferase component (E2) [Batrachochytrium dendrobatidis]KAK5665938.1 pyruvate dehydrogenase complex dihydrolipoamide acetyltransferase component (E2) [Batrachochytrium dendrobatidis]